MMSQPFVPNVVRFKKSRRRVPEKMSEHRRVHLIKYPYGLQATENGKLFSNHIEMMRKTIANYFARKEKQFMRIYPNRSYTAKPCDVRRGRGKGSVDSWYFYVKANRILVEFTSSTEARARDLARILRSKLPIKVLMMKLTDPTAPFSTDRSTPAEKALTQITCKV